MPPKNTKYNIEYLQTQNVTAEVYFYHAHFCTYIYRRELLMTFRAFKSTK